MVSVWGVDEHGELYYRISGNGNAFRQVVYRALGEEKGDFFFDRYLILLFTDEDAALSARWV